ncbi:glycosyl transferase family 2 [Stanieria cyanosphaera PCC 7437]|uniref:Glycosyl transferase family 2 n=1 Tax=Stanieria cyanosphaera (strain ATCC 29371 / PCC 7437) TaxID=111780 RepID=K9XSC7_STAC7|nr:glycosyltransferase [Stanieria cyanosphaera]AFZ34989.1 glycosyl transferase family 2 [Stanieria cyanosphaera PCC 7437]
MNQPWLSVIIPTYNGADYLAAALDSIVMQQESGIECIVVDDGSTDTTLEILDSYQDQLPLQIIKRNRIGNWVTNTNYGLSLAQGEYVCFLHQDDLWFQDRLKNIKEVIASYPQANLYLHSSLFIDTQGKPLGTWRCPLPSYPTVIKAELMMERLLVQNFIAIPAPVFSRKVALDVGGLNEELWYTADWDFWLKIAASGETIYYPQPLAAFRVHPNSQTVRRSSSLSEFHQQMRSVFEQHLTKWETNINNKLKIRRVALFSTEVNTALAAMVHGEKTNLCKLGGEFVSLTPRGWYRYFRDSRILERVFARLKARLQTTSS